ncbi:Bug family tripartite tricarboxylate transporter substrate binding protein [Ramlibacter albus]|uniref:Tripartite tricarboxylate transporter substrate binding protein n=1 Tax=Ramlibacter albus TaxID=2079448 RepID=A0A923S5B8_9BURK|nr:tripartite tricarboxylate transporter substrate binding protein [Ramlibacter albus]MBC5768454.1 tripartite tricarboxylate transporter substrate binding protein [Ramlibacter albus]
MRALFTRWLPALACTALCAMALANDYPTRPVTAVPAFPPGTPNDFIMRLVGEKFAAEFKQPLIVDNKPGAGGNVAAEAVSRAAPDGYTLLATVDTVVTANPSLYKTNFSADTDLAPVLYLANAAQTLVCNPSVPVKSVGDLVALARAQRMSYASGGHGVPGHLAAELFAAATGVQMTHVPYRGPGPAAQDVMAGVVPCGFLATAVVMPHVKAGKLQALAVTSARRSPIAPDVPTMAEAGIANYEVSFGEVLLAPKGTPPQVIRQLNTAIGRVLQQPDVREKMLAADLEFVPNTPEQAAARLKQERQRWKQVIERLGLRADG